jgi:hypothetical protein
MEKGKISFENESDAFIDNDFTLPDKKVFCLKCGKMQAVSVHVKNIICSDCLKIVSTVEFNAMKTELSSQSERIKELEDALKRMLNVFGRELVKDSLGERACRKARKVLGEN